MARRFGRLGCHPEPQGGHEGNAAICRDQFRVVQQIFADSLAARAIVEIPGQLKWPPAVIGVSRRTWISGARRIAVDDRRVLFVYEDERSCPSLLLSFLFTIECPILFAHRAVQRLRLIGRPQPRGFCLYLVECFPPSR